MDELMTALSQIYRPPGQLTGATAGLVFATAMLPGEQTSEDDPPEWDRREEGWTIDGLLGCYDASSSMITIFKKGIDFAAPQIGTTAELLTIIVRLHEWAHATFHLGVDQATSTSLAKASLGNGTLQIEDTCCAMTQAYQAADSYVHEQIAQVLTRLALDDLLVGASVEQAKNSCTEAIAVFERLMRRQPEQYSLDWVKRLEMDRLRNRLRGFIALTRRRQIEPLRQVWDTVMPW
ncbi:MAG: hypothetical protein SGJ07_10990 [Rhodospirillaceae bacterium]|nr:hypothetical protein [Rhodospirillaceae bacterium]